jgi:hypothetical protein
VGDGAGSWQGQASFEGLQPSQLNSRWPAQTLKGQARASLNAQTLNFELRAYI